MSNVELPVLTDEAILKIKNAALNALPQSERDQGDEMNAMFAFKLLLDPLTVLALIAQQDK